MFNEKVSEEGIKIMKVLVLKTETGESIVGIYDDDEIYARVARQLKTKFPKNVLKEQQYQLNIPNQ